jgi:hypothetical protein
VLVWKSATTEAGAKAAASHTANMTGRSELFRAAFRQSGLIEVDDVEPMVDIAKLVKQGRMPAGNRIGVLSISGGSGIVFADRAVREGLVLPPFSAKTVAALKAKQRKDGGWSLPSLGSYKRRDIEKTPNDPNAESDGYGTGFVAYVLLVAGEKPNAESIGNAVKWLKANQRESGRWFTRSLNNDKAHYIANAGTAFCVLALHEAGAAK